MTAKTLEEEARKAAERWYPPGAGRLGGKLYAGKPAKEGFRERSSFQHGYLAAATARDKEIEELRARVKELEERAAQWVPESGLKSLMDQGWTEFYNDKRGNEPRLWLMVPPIPLPEGDGDAR